MKFRVGKRKQDRKVMVHTQQKQKVLEEGRRDWGKGERTKIDRLSWVNLQRIDTLSPFFFCLVSLVSLHEASRPTPRHGRGVDGTRRRGGGTCREVGPGGIEPPAIGIAPPSGGPFLSSKPYLTLFLSLPGATHLVPLTHLFPSLNTISPCKIRIDVGRI